LNYLKINPKLDKRYIRIKNSNLIENSKIDSNLNFSTLVNLTSTNNSLMKIKVKKESNKKHNLSKINIININNYTEIIPYHFLNTRNINNNINNKASLNSSYLKNTSFTTSSFRNIENLTRYKKIIYPSHHLI
jgi:hypothetical protein